MMGSSIRSSAALRSLLALVWFLGVCSPGHASDCDSIVTLLLAGVPDLKFASTSHLAGAPNFDVAYFKHPQAGAIALSCGRSEPSLSVDWRGGSPPSGYFELTGLLASIVTGVPVAAIRSGVEQCQKLASATAYEMSGFELAGLRFECAIFTHEGGGMSVTIHRIAR